MSDEVILTGDKEVLDRDVGAAFKVKPATKLCEVLEQLDRLVTTLYKNTVQTFRGIDLPYVDVRAMYVSMALKFFVEGMGADGFTLTYSVVVLLSLLTIAASFTSIIDIDCIITKTIIKRISKFYIYL